MKQKLVKTCILLVAVMLLCLSSACTETENLQNSDVTQKETIEINMNADGRDEAVAGEKSSYGVDADLKPSPEEMGEIYEEQMMEDAMNALAEDAQRAMMEDANERSYDDFPL